MFLFACGLFFFINTIYTKTVLDCFVAALVAMTMLLKYCVRSSTSGYYYWIIKTGLSGD